MVLLLHSSRQCLLSSLTFSFSILIYTAPPFANALQCPLGKITYAIIEVIKVLSLFLPVPLSFSSGHFAMT